MEPRAIVNHQVVSIGDAVEGARVVAIGPDRVTFEFADQRFTVLF